eukprot:6978556-Lingulodinium_polyedra.AAC.1
MVSPPDKKCPITVSVMVSSPTPTIPPVFQLGSGVSSPSVRKPSFLAKRDTIQLDTKYDTAWHFSLHHT